MSIDLKSLTAPRPPAAPAPGRHALALEPRPLSLRVARDNADVLEAARKPLVQLKDPFEKQRHEALEKFVYGRKLDGMSDEELAAEIARQQERHEESTTGVDQDPARAADAAWRLAAAKAELEHRELIDPELDVGEYQARLTQLSDAELAREEQRLLEAIGSDTDAEHLDGYTERLAAVRSERAQRTVDDPKTTLGEYREAVNALSDDAVLAEQAQLQAELEALKAEPGNFAQKLQLQLRLAVLNAEVKQRGLDCAGTEQAEQSQQTEQTEQTEQTAEAEAGGTEMSTRPYTIEQGDTIGDLAWEISQQNGGDPTPDEVAADILRLNPQITDPNVIGAGDPMTLPVYG